MRTIQKQISLEPMTSRLPSVWPAYKDNELYFFDEESLKSEKRQWQYTSNWGMVPVNIVLNHNPSEGLPYSAYSIVSCEENCSCSGHCYNGEYTTVSGTPTHCLDESGNCVCCEVDDFLNVVPSQTPYYYDKFINFTLSFENLSKWYYFFNEYYNLLKEYGHCNRVYTSAEDYYNYESGSKYANQMIYGTDKQTYLDLDKEFAEKGGIVKVLTFNKDTSEYSGMTPEEAHDETNGDNMAMIDVYDVGFFKWICENVVPSFIIPMKYRDYWERDRLFYPDVIKWMAWFKEKLDYERVFVKGVSGEVDTWDCKNESVEDCCVCDEYFKRGGKRIYDEMSNWYNMVKETISSNTSIISASTNCFVPTAIIPTELQLSADNLGDFKVLSEDYELGVDYRTANGLASNTNTNQGTVVNMDGHTVILSNGNGYTFDQVYMEKYVSRCLEEACGYEGVFYEKCPKCGSKNVEVVGWDDYTNYYVNHTYTYDDGLKYTHKNDFYVSAITYFAYDAENVKYVSSASTEESAIEDLRDKMSQKYELATNDNGWILIDGNLYEIYTSEYGIYDKQNKFLGNKKYMVLREDGTNTPYTYINGKQIYAELYRPKNEFYFPFFKAEDYARNEVTYSGNTFCSGKTFNFNDYVHYKRNKLNEDYRMYYIYYDDNAYGMAEDAKSIIINDAEFYRISAYTIDNGNNMVYYTYDNKLVSGDVLSEISEDEAKIEIINEKPYVVVDYPFDIEMYKADEINGRSVSKLSDLRLYNVLTDDIGNNIDGVYEVNRSVYNHQPPEGSELEPLYQVGNTANISRFYLTNDVLDEPMTANYFVGDIITRMTFYYKETDETIPEETVTDVKLINSADTYVITIEHNGKTTTLSGDEITYTSLNAIHASNTAKTELEKSEEVIHSFYEDIFCDITYYIGATLRRKNGENYNLCYEENRNNHGVEYKESVRFVKERKEYYLKKELRRKDIIPLMRNKVSAHSISYPIYVYKMTQEMKHVDNSQYDSSYEVPMADFKFNINIFSGNGDTFSQKYSDDMAEHNNLQVFPVYREEYNLGASSLENVETNIYIDRGISAAFERHLKLGEVTTMEALEQYGNNFFKIMES